MNQSRPSVAVWFEIPATDFDRAISFYETLLAVTLRRENMGNGIQLAIFPYEKPAISGCIIQGGPYQPASGGAGVVVYLNCDGCLDAVIERAQAAGGTLAGPKIALPQGMGTFIHVIDTEGNKVGLHAVF